MATTKYEGWQLYAKPLFREVWVAKRKPLNPENMRSIMDDKVNVTESFYEVLYTLLETKYKSVAFACPTWEMPDGKLYTIEAKIVEVKE
jgi:hypothetical protein